jgi:hypothetical protein
LEVCGGAFEFVKAVTERASQLRELARPDDEEDHEQLGCPDGFKESEG